MEVIVVQVNIFLAGISKLRLRIVRKRSIQSDCQVIRFLLFVAAAYRTMSEAEDTVPHPSAVTTADSDMVSTVSTAVSLPTPASLGPSLPAETIQQIAGAVAAILQPSLSSGNLLSSGELPGPSTRSRPSDPIYGKCSVNIRTLVHLCVGSKITPVVLVYHCKLAPSAL